MPAKRISREARREVFMAQAEYVAELVQNGKIEIVLDVTGLGFEFTEIEKNKRAQTRIF